MNQECIYKKICNQYDDTCKDKQNCWVFNTLEGILNKEMFQSKIRKRIFREEHGHKKYEEAR